MKYKKFNKTFQLVAIKGTSDFASFGSVVPKAAQQFLVRVDEIDHRSGTEIAIFEPKLGEYHLEGSFYVGMTVNETMTETPPGMDYIELHHEYVTTRGNIRNIASLHQQLLNWSIEQGYKRNLDTYIVETYHPLENGTEEVEIYLPIHSQ
ncbi:AraC family transcriptional regulator [Caldibacillus lycopersici]|uniref:AraC family transcriptional regulator n=1 Tax=Perspicuibacillus lycopersici TaxID=1325689 RepID=A0AAE3IRH7_9BACI|nr:AraC family transcriptional regulator [Perspicuibacillus lycopersici]MCU9613111.1 AraC family transcriptional regulator [Perspicuibacillus lycopersici]